MIRPKHALLYAKQLAVHRLSLGMFALQCEGHSQVASTRQRGRMLRPKHALVRPKHLAPVVPLQWCPALLSSAASS